MHVAEKDVLHEMVKIVKKKARMFLEYFGSKPMSYLLSFDKYVKSIPFAYCSLTFMSKRRY